MLSMKQPSGVKPVGRAVEVEMVIVDDEVGEVDEVVEVVEVD